MLHLIFNVLYALKIVLKRTEHYGIIEMQLCAWLTYRERVTHMSMRMKTEKTALHVSCEGWTGAAFGVTLFGDAYTDVAALVTQKERGRATLRFFDPYAPADDVFAGGWPEGATLYIVRGRRCVRWKGDK